MIQKIKNLVLALSFASLIVAPLAVPSVANAATANNDQQTVVNGNLCAGSNFDLNGDSSGTNTKAGDTSNCTQDASTLSSKIKTILNVLSAVVGVAAVIMIIYAGFRYVTSAGSEGGVKTAKNAIIYAIIGLVIVALAQVIVHFVISNATSS